MPYSSSIAVFVLDIFLGEEETPVALIKRHPDGFLWHTAEKWELGKKGAKPKRHRSPVFATPREAVGNCLVWLEKCGVDASKPRVEKHDVRFEPGRTRTAGALTDEVLAAADDLLAHIPKEILGGKKETAEPRSARREAIAVTGSESRPSPTPVPPRVEQARRASPQSRVPVRSVSGYTPMTGHDRAAR